MSKHAKIFDLDIARLKKKVRALDKLEADAHAIRLELAQALVIARPRWPERGPTAKGWGEFLDSIGLTQQKAWHLMQLIAPPQEGFTGPVKPAENKSADHRDQAPAGPGNWQLDHNGPLQGDEPPRKKGTRDGWCTDPELAALLPRCDLDPCSNPHSVIRAAKTYSLEAGQNGLELPWFGIVYVNGPFSDLEPWTVKAELERASVKALGFMCNTDSSPAWWKRAVGVTGLRLDFHDRREFIPPPGIEPSTNDRPQTLLMDRAFLDACDPKIRELGTLWAVVP